MSWINLKATISAVIKANNKQEITGTILNSIFSSVINNLGANAQFAGIATPETSLVVQDGPTFWIAGQAGTYNLGGTGVVVGHATLAIFTWDCSTWNYGLIPISGVITVDNLIEAVQEATEQIRADLDSLREQVYSDLQNYVNDGSYNSETKNIELKHDNTVLATIDATAFIKDGMVDSVVVENGNLVITFNTESGKEPISIPLSQIFNPSNYYTKVEVNEVLRSKQNIINDLADIRSGAQAGSTAVQPSTLNSIVKSTVAESGVYDVSANSDNTKFESLSALLSSANLNTFIPTDIRKSGMSIKFVQSSDNKYVQYLYVGTSIAITDFTNVANWEKTNLEIGIKELNQDVSGKYDYSFYAAAGEHRFTLDLFPIDYKAGTTLKGQLSLGTAAFDGSKLSVALIKADGTTRTLMLDITVGQEFEISAPSDAAYIGFYIWRITTAGTFLVTLQYGGLQEQSNAQSEEISKVESLVYSGFNNGMYAIGGTEIPGVETTDNCLLLWDSGKPSEYANPAWQVKKYPVTPRTNYHLVGSTRYGNAVFSVIDSNGIVIYKEKGATNGPEIIDKIYCTPEAAVFIYVGYVTTIKNGILTNVEIVPNEDPETSGKWKGKKWVAIGDSLTEVNSRTTKHYFDYIAEKTGISVVNMGLSGSGYRRKFDTNQAFYQRVANVPTDADVITIFGSFNDLGVADYAVGEPTDTTTDTICGCINNTLDTILSVYMDAEKVPTIGVITPTPWIGTGPADPTNSSSLYCDAVIACCKRKGIPVLDLFRCSNLHPNNATFRTLAYSKDEGNGVHPDETGHKIIAPMFENLLESLLLN